MNSREETERLSILTGIAKRVLPKYEMRGVFRLVEDSPAGQKCQYLELEVDNAMLDKLFGGVFLACPRGDRTNGYTMLEISTRDNKIMPRRGSSRDALLLQEAYSRENEKFEIVY